MSADISNEHTRNCLHQINGSAVYKTMAILASVLAIPLKICGLQQESVWRVVNIAHCNVVDRSL